MIRSLRKFFRKLTGRRQDEGADLTVHLDEESMERLRRLKYGMKRIDEDALVALSLKCLEQKWKMILKRQKSMKPLKMQAKGRIERDGINFAGSEPKRAVRGGYAND